MDKILVNNQIVLMRKIVRKSKRFVYQKLVKQIKKLKTLSDKTQSEKSAKKWQNKMKNREKELIAVRGVNVDEVSTEALIHDKTYFEDLIKSCNTSIESRSLARIAVHEEVTKAVNKFKEDNPNCDQWLSSLIELWNHKKTLKRNKITQKKGSENNETNKKEVEVKAHKKADKVSLKVGTTDMKKSKQNNKIKVKVNVKSKAPIKEVKSKTMNEPNQEVKSHKSDPFFLSDNMDDEDDEQHDNSIDTNDRNMNTRNTSQNRNFRSHERKQNYSSRIEKSGLRNDFKPNIKTKTFDKKSDRSPQRPQGATINKASNEAPNQSVHPSWAAKQAAKDKFKIDLNQKPMAKRIKFSDN